MKMLKASLDSNFNRYSRLTFVRAGGKWVISNTSLRFVNFSAICFGNFESSMPSSLTGREYFGGILSGLILWPPSDPLVVCLVFWFTKLMKLSMDTKLDFNCGNSDAVNCITHFLENCDCQPA